MSKIKLTGENSGYVEISAGQNAGNNTLETPTSGTRLVAHEGSQDVTLNANLTVNGVLTYDDVTNIDSVGVITARAGVHVTGGSVGIGTDSPSASHSLTVRSSNDTTFTNNPSNIFVAGTDTSGSGNSGAGINFGGRYRDDNGNTTAFAVVSGIKENTTHNNWAGALTFATRTHGNTGGNQERLRITSTGKIGIGQADPQGDLHIGNISGNKDIIMHSANNGTATLRFREGGSLGSGYNEYSIGMVGAANAMTVNGQGAGEIIRIMGDTSKIGINDTNPERAIDIRADNCMVQLEGTGGGGRQYSLCSTDNTTGASAGSAGSFVIYDDTSGNARLSITSDGKIGISDTSPENTLSIKNIGSFEGDANSFYLGSNFTGTGQNFSGSGKHAQRFFFNNASSNGYLKFENTGTTGNAGDAITWQERFRIRADGTIRIGGDYYTNTAIQMSLKSSSTGCQIQMHGTGTGTSSSDGLRVGYNGAGGQMWLFESGYIRFATSNVERLRIHSSGVAQFTTTGTQYVSASAPAFVVNSNGDHALVINNQNTTDPRGLFIYQDQDVNNGTSYFWRARAGSSDKAHLYTNGNLNISGGLEASSVNLQSSSTASWFQTGANYGGADYVWAAKNTQTNTWHSGLKTTGDLYLGGNITATRNISLNGSNGSAHFTGQLIASPFALTAGSSSYVKSIYGAISNSTVSSLNNLLIGQNMRGYLNSDGVSTNNNFYSIQNYNAGQMGHAGTEYCYGGITKFYNDTNASTANATFTPVETARIDTSGSIYVANSFRISTTSGGTSLPNPYSLGALASATIPSYQHITGIWVVLGSVPCNNTWHDLLHSFSDSNGMFHGYCGDASSKNIYQYQYSMTSPAYGVNNLSQRFMNGAWNTGSVSFQIRNNSGAWTLQIKATSHYNSSNNAGFRIMFHSYY